MDATSDSFRSVLTGNLVGNVTAIVVPWILLLLAPILVIPTRAKADEEGGGHGWRDYEWRILTIAGLVLVAAATVIWVLLNGGRERAFNGIMFAVFLAALVVVLSCAICGVFEPEAGSSNRFDGLGPTVLFGITAGMFSLAGFAIGLGLFSDIKSAAAVPIVILFVMTAVHPYAKCIDEPIRKQLIQWMGVIIGLSAVADGVSMIGSH